MMISDEDLLLYHYGDGLDADAHRRIAAALDTQAELAARLQKMVAELDATVATESAVPASAMRRWQASLERAGRVDNGAASNILAPALSGASFSWRAGLAAFGVVLLAAGISLSMFTTRTTPDLAPDGDPKVSATALATNDPANGASRYERGLQWHLAQTEQLLAGLGAASREEQAALIDKAMMQNRLYAIAADRAREDRLARVLRSFNPLLENLLDVRSDKYAFEGGIAQLNFELKVMQARLATAAPISTRPFVAL